MAMQRRGNQEGGLDRRSGDERRQRLGPEVVATLEGFAQVGTLTAAQSRILVQELQVHQIELEMQNEELCRAQMELEVSRENYFDLYNLAPVGYLTLSARSQILELNLTAANLLGSERGKLLRMPFTTMIHPEDLTLYYQRQKQGFAQGASQGFELRLLAQAGSVVWVHVQAAVARDREGAAVWRVTLSDISERKATETALFQAQKLESLGVLAGGIAHDFNNLLTAMLGNLEMAALDQSGADRDKHHGVVRDCVLRAAGLCRQMLAYAGKGQFNRQALRLDELVKAYLGFLQLSIAKGVAIQLDLEPDLAEIEGDSFQIEQALMNMVVNGSEALGPEGGTLRIRARRRTVSFQDPPVMAAGTQVAPGPHVVLEVEDSGSGMDPATLKKIFDPFFTTKFIGRGLGLAALLGIMRVNGGGVQVRSAPGQGTCFSLWFPLATDPAPLPEDPAPDCSPIPAAGTILVVDDEAPVRTVLRALLGRMGFAVLEAADGEEGVGAYRQSEDAIGLVFMDLTLPRMGGLEAARRILEEFPEARIVFMSGYGIDPSEGSPVAERIKGFLKKPFLRSELAAIVARAWVLD